MDQDIPPNTAAQHASPHHAAQPKPSPPPSTPLPVFFLPRELVSSLVPLAQTEAPAPDSLHGPGTSHRRSSLVPEPATAAVATSLDSKVPSCRVCGISTFDSVEKQREHVKLDWHRYNLKQQLLDKKAKPISEPQFENMIQDLSSISGSDEEEDSDDEEGAVKPHTSAAAANSNRSKDENQEALIQSLMKKLELTVQENQKARHQDPVLVHQQQLLEQQLQEARLSPMIWFKTPLYDETVRIGIYKNALPNKGQCDNIVDYLQSLQFHVEPVVKKQKSNKARREARRAAAAAEQSGDAGEKHDGDDEAHKSPDSTADDKLETLPTQPHSGPQQREGKEEEEEEEDEGEDEPDWLKYQKQSKQVQTTAIKPPHQARYWTLIMIGGGHFAGVVMDLAGQVSSHGRDAKVVAHKTFHRYTVRRKQGGSQAAHGFANSAGARIRMYNEEALKLEVRELLDGWSHWIKQSECVFVHSPGNNRRVLFYDNSVLSTAERQGRIRSIPFMTKRPTLSELKRAYQELTTVKVSVLTKEALDRKEMAEQEALERALEASSARSAKGQDSLKKVHQQATVPDASPELLKLIELVKKGRAEAMSSHLLKHGMDASQALPLTTSTEYDTHRTPTILHIASHYGQAQVVKLLLEKHLADPTMTSGKESALPGTVALTAYDIAKDKETRNAFRRAMALLPDTWDWAGLAHVPSALTPEMEADQERKAKEKTRKLLDAERERKKTREISRPTTPAGQSTNSTLPAGSSSSSSASLMAKNMAAVSAANSHLSPEMRMRLERERRANAAEARMAAQRQTETIRRAVQGGENICVACGKSLVGLTPFDKFGRKFCTTDCVAKGPA